MTPKQLAFYMRGFAETSSEPPTRAQWGVLREAILSATQLQFDIPPTLLAGPMPPEVKALFASGCKDCAPQGGKEPPPPVIDESKV